MMKGWLAVAGVCLLNLVSVADTKYLTHGWQFRREGGDWQEVTVPHDWAIDGPFDKENDKQLVRIVENQEEKATEKTGRTGALPWIGKGEYRIDLEIPEDVAFASLVFDGAMSEPEVFLDGEKIGEWKYGYTPFEIPIRNPVPGTHELFVKLNNRPRSSRWYPGAGLIRPVRLVCGYDGFIRPFGQRIYCPDTNTVVVTTEVAGDGSHSGGLLYFLDDAEGNSVARSTNGVLKVSRPKPWSPENPYLYTLHTFYGHDHRIDRVGIRTVEYGRDFFRLNGVKRSFRGVCLHHDLGPLGAAFNQSAFRRQVRILKEMGCDSIRTSHNHPAPWQLDICDEMGMMVLAESFDEWEEAKCENGYHLWFRDWWKRDLRQLVACANHHPSVVMWSVGNEIGDQTKSRGVEILGEMQSFIHSLDPDKRRLVSAGASHMPAAVKSGFVAKMEIPAVTYRLPFYEAIHAVDTSKPMLGIETASTFSSRGVYRTTDEPRMLARYADRQCGSFDTEYACWSNLPDDDWAMQDDHDWTIGEFVWTGFDYLGEPSPYDDYWPSRSSYFGILDLAGLRKDRYYLYRSRWNTEEPTLHVLPHWSWGEEARETAASELLEIWRNGDNRKVSEKPVDKSGELFLPVHVYTSYPAAELFVNGKSYGRKTYDESSRLDRYRLRWANVKYEPGELKVVAYDSEGKRAAEKIVRTAGKPARIVAAVEPRTDRPFDVTAPLVYVDVRIVDKDGNICPDAAIPVTVKVRGKAKHRCFCNGDATSVEPFQGSVMNTFKGELVATVEETSTGSWEAEFSAPGLESGFVHQGGKLHVIANGENGPVFEREIEFSGERAVLEREGTSFDEVVTLDVYPDFATAKKGEEGYFLMPDGLMGYFNRDDGEFCPYERAYHPIWMMKTPRVNFMAQGVGMPYSFEPHAVAKDGEYRLFMRYRLDGDMPYEDISVDFKFASADRTWCDFAREYRDYQLKSGNCSPIVERMKDYPALRYAATNLEVRLRQGWKPVPAKVRDQTPFTEPPVKVAITFDRCRDIMKEFRRQGIPEAEFCLVGWNKGGHDGAYPQLFPVEPAMGGEAKLRALLKDAKAMGFQTVAHNNYSDAYLIADTFDEEFLRKRKDGTPFTAGTWGGGFQYLSCAQRMCEKYLVKDLEMIRALGFFGLHYIDVISSKPLRKCYDPRHPQNEKDWIRWNYVIERESKKRLGGFASEGIFDYCVGDLDYCLYGYFYRLVPDELPKLMDHHVPLAQIIYNGIVLVNPFCGTVNYTIKDNVKRLKLVEFGGRPVFYFYTNFVDGFHWMGEEDLTCATDEELKQSVAAVKKGYDEFRGLSDLQLVFMDNHEYLTPEVTCTTYANGVKVVVNYGRSDFDFKGIKVPAGDWRRIDR